MTTADIQALIVSKANQYGVPPNLALGVASHESSFNPNAVNTANANGTKDWGVMQLNDTTVQTMGVSNPLDPTQNIDAGVRLLSSLLNRYGGDPNQALWAYASGPGNVGPGKTPNATAQGFINYVTSYNGGIDTSATSADPGQPFDPNAPAQDFTDAGVIDWPTLALVGAAGFAIWLLVDWVQSR